MAVRMKLQNLHQALVYAIYGNARTLTAAVLGLAALLGMFAPGAAYAATLPAHHLYLAGAGIPTVGYGTAPNGVSTQLNGALEGFASLLRDLLGGLGLLVIVAGAIVNMMAHNPQVKSMARTFIEGAIVSLLIGIFAPTIVNALASL